MELSDTYYKVLCLCCTYNQSVYIEYALNGFANQTTKFPYVALIIDDCSTDGEQDIIKLWLKQNCDMDNAKYSEDDLALHIDANHKTNINCLFHICLLKKNLYGKQEKTEIYKPWFKRCKYWAFCEGDDYWIDPFKIQKQADILDYNPKCSIVISNGECLNVHTGKTHMINPFGENAESGFINIETMLTEQALTPTASMCIRTEYMYNRPDFFEKCPVGDKPARTWAALNGDVYYIHEATTLYREGAIGSFSYWSSKSKKYAKKLYDGMHDYYVALDRYTNGDIHNVITELDRKEEYYYFKRIRNLHLMIKSSYFKSLSRNDKYNEIKKYCIENTRHAGRIALTKLHMNWIYPKRHYK